MPEEHDIDMYDKTTKIHLTLKFFYKRVFDDVLVTDVESYYTNDAQDELKTKHYFVRMCAENFYGKGNQLKYWQDIEGNHLKKETGFKNIVSVSNSPFFHCYAQASLIFMIKMINF